MQRPHLRTRSAALDGARECNSGAGRSDISDAVARDGDRMGMNLQLTVASRFTFSMRPSPVAVRYRWTSSSPGRGKGRLVGRPQYNLGLGCRAPQHVHAHCDSREVGSAFGVDRATAPATRGLHLLAHPVDGWAAIPHARTLEVARLSRVTVA